MFVIFRLYLFIYSSNLFFFSPSKIQNWDRMGQTVCWWRGDCLLMEQRCSRSRLPARFAERCLPVADGSRSAASVLNSKDSLEWGLRVSWINCRVTKFRPWVQGAGDTSSPPREGPWSRGGSSSEHLFEGCSSSNNDIGKVKEFNALTS